MLAQCVSTGWVMCRMASAGGATRMSHTYAQNVVHVVFSTKERRKLISLEFRPSLWAYVGGICKNLGIFAHGIGGTDDHIHLLIQIPPAMALAKAVMSIKANSSRWAREGSQELAWQQGYGAFSVSASLVPAVLKYIRDQDAHHRKMNFEEEFLALLKRHGVAFDPKFIFG
jgi:putative transposase